MALVISDGGAEVSDGGADVSDGGGVWDGEGDSVGSGGSMNSTSQAACQTAMPSVFQFSPG